jgi:hypothetical protein
VTIPELCFDWLVCCRREPTVRGGFLYTPEALTDLLNTYYLDFLERAPDSSGESYWLSVLESLIATKAQVGEDFFSSQEFFTDT